MAVRQYSITSTAAAFGAVTETSGTSIGSEIVRLLVDDANAASKMNVLRAIDELRDYIAADTWPPN